MDTRQPAKFYHETTCKVCTKDDICVNTHRTDFVGQDHGNKAFNVVAKKVRHDAGFSITLSSNIERLRGLVEALMKKQETFFLNEYPEECEHLQYFDLDADIPEDLLMEIVNTLNSLTTGCTTTVLRNTVSKKVHLILDVPAATYRHSPRKKAIATWISAYLYEQTEVAAYYTKTDWEENIFDAKAAGIRAALSHKVRAGTFEQDKGVYILAGVFSSDCTYTPATARLDQLTYIMRVQMVLDCSIYNEPAANWTADTIEQFELVEQEISTRRAVAKSKDRDDYMHDTKTIHFQSRRRLVDGAFINELISTLSSLWSDKSHWFHTLTQVKAAAQLVEDFKPEYFLHEWSARNQSLYNKQGNDDRYNRCRVNLADAGFALTWLRNRATGDSRVDDNLYRGDLGLAEIFVDTAADRIKVVSDDGSCYLWDDKLRLWKSCGNKWVRNEVSRELEGVYLEQIRKLQGIRCEDKDAKEAIAKEIKRLSKAKTTILCDRPAISVVNKAIPFLEDKDFIKRINLQPDLMPIQGGLVVNLQTGETTNRLPTHNFTFECPVKIDRDPVRRAVVHKFMEDICGDLGLLRYLQVALGYCITGRVNEKAVFVWWGELGDNGKSTVMNLLKACLGEYCKPASKCLFIKTKQDGKLTPEREVLKDTRLVMFSETAPDDELNDELLKMASGDDLIRVNPKYQAEYDFRSYAKLLVASNHKPRINVSDPAMVRRIKFIPFQTKFVDEPAEAHERLKDGTLVRQMETELLDAFFTWVLDGAIQWYKSGLVDIPAVMERATAEYIAENDELADFLADVTEPGAGFIQVTSLYSKYRDWCNDQNLKPKGSKTFAQDLGKKIGKEKRSCGMVFLKLKFKETTAESPLRPT